MEFHIENTVVYGMEKSIIASGNPMRTKMKNNEGEVDEKDLKRAVTLGNVEIGSGHDQFLTGIIVQFDIYAPLYMWKEIQRYHFLDFVSSQSTMHCITKFKLANRCTSDVDPRIIEIVQGYIDEYNAQEKKDKKLWRKIIANIPSGFVLGATMTTNYRQLKTMYTQRENHKLHEWSDDFTAWCISLPNFVEFCIQGRHEPRN